MMRLVLMSGCADAQLPDMATALQLLEEEHRRRHFVEYEPDFEVFIRNLKVALDGHQLPRRAFDELFSDTNLTRHPDCDGCATPATPCSVQQTMRRKRPTAICSASTM